MADEALSFVFHPFCRVARPGWGWARNSRNWTRELRDKPYRRERCARGNEVSARPWRACVATVEIRPAIVMTPYLLHGSECIFWGT